MVYVFLRDMPSLLEMPLEYLKGINPQWCELFRKEQNVHTLGDLLFYFPYRYVDRSTFTNVQDLSDANQYVQLIGKFSNLRELGEGRAKRLSAIFSDQTGSVEVVWFNGIKWIKNFIKPGETYVLFDKPAIYNGRFNFNHPEIEPLSVFQSSGKTGLQALYNTSEKMKKKGLNSRNVHKIIHQLLLLLRPDDVPEILPPDILTQFQLRDRYTSVKDMHQPAMIKDFMAASKRLKFEELLVLQLQLLRLKLLRTKDKGIILEKLGDYFNTFYHHHLPFQLTEAQKRVIRKIRKDTLSGHQMNRLLQGDVGSGKTIVAVLTMLMALDNGFQSALMAPTEILAQQHFIGIAPMLEPLGIRTALLTGSVKGRERKQIMEGLADGSIHIAIGTHALIEDTVIFNNLGMVVIDEQHRFGVAQRARLRDKAALPPHILVMTATPIPRSLALIFYGDLDYSVIDELPPGRKPVKTVHMMESSRLRVYGFLREQIAAGRQVYIVYPLIEESEKSDLADLMNGFENICRNFPPPQYQVSVVHGKMKPEVKEHEMQRFVKGETHIMVATTVIEVGVNVPNASVMVIENAERFGLSQLHQLRGRVGRGAEQSYCILMTSYKLTRESKVRIETMCATNDGFRISEVDLDLRGPGDVEGTRQSGQVNLRLAHLAKDKEILEQAREAATDIMKADPNLEYPKHHSLKHHLLLIGEAGNNWSKVL
jgi:ATP-dependent DNA helicase RecG